MIRNVSNGLKSQELENLEERLSVELESRNELAWAIDVSGSDWCIGYDAGED